MLIISTVILTFSALESLGIAIEYAFLHYPMFACLTTDFKLTGAAMGLLYTLTWYVWYGM